MKALELHCLDQARVGVPRERRVTIRELLQTTLRYRSGMAHYLPGALERIEKRVERTDVTLDEFNDRTIDFVECAVLDEEAAARMAIARVGYSGWACWSRQVVEAGL